MGSSHSKPDSTGSVLDQLRLDHLQPAHPTADLPLAQLRDDTPGTKNVLHFNNAGSSLPPLPVLKAVEEFLEEEAAIGGYEAVDRYAAALERPYSSIASLINCQPSEVAILTSATAAWQQVVYGLAWQWRPGDRIFTSVAEYGSNYIAYLQIQRRTGVRIEAVPETPGGDIDLEAAERMILEEGRKPVLISITYIPTSSGKVYDAEGVGKLAKRHGILYMLDACQTVGQIPLDVQHVGCDFLSATGRKYLRGPRGSGFLYVSRHALNRFEPAVVDNVGARWVASGAYELQPTAKRFESYEMSFAAKAGLGVAVDYCLAVGVERIWPRVQHLAHILRAGLVALPGVRVWDHGRVLCGIVSFTKAGMPAETIQQRLAVKSINVSVSRVGSSRLDFEKRGLQEVVRASVHYYNLEREVQVLLDAVREL